MERLRQFLDKDALDKAKRDEDKQARAERRKTAAPQSSEDPQEVASLFAENLQTGMRKSRKQVRGKPADLQGEKPQAITKTSSETSSKTHLRQQQKPAPAPQKTAPAPEKMAAPVVVEVDESISILRAEKVILKRATELAQAYPLEQIKRQIALLPTRSIKRSRTGTLIASIQEDWPADQVPYRPVASGKSLSLSFTERLKAEKARLPVVPEAEIEAARVRFHEINDATRQRLEDEANAKMKRSYPTICELAPDAKTRKSAILRLMFVVVTEYERSTQASPKAAASPEAIEDDLGVGMDGADDLQAAQEAAATYRAARKAATKAEADEWFSTD